MFHVRNFMMIAGLLSAGSSTSADDGSLAITNVTIINTTGGASLTGQTVIVRAGRIAEIGDVKQVVISKDAQVIDGQGKYLIPGLWDMHVHLTEAKALDYFLAHGVTGVRHMYSLNFTFTVGKQLRDGMPGQPRVVAANRALDGRQPSFSALAAVKLKRVHTANEAKAAVRDLKNDGEQFIKVFTLLPREAYFAALAEARIQGLPVVGHIPHDVSAEEACDAGQNCIDHLAGIPFQCAKDGQRFRKDLAEMMKDGKLIGAEAASAWRFQLKAHEDYDADRAKVFFAKLKKNHTWQVPTLVESRARANLGENAFIQDERLKWMPTIATDKYWKVERDGVDLVIKAIDLRYSPRDLDGRKRLFASELKLIAALHAAGVPLLAGTDSPSPYCFPGSGLHDELSLLVQAGLSPLEALQTATLNPARCLGLEAELGSITKGKRADLVLLEADPLEKIDHVRRISGVIAGGHYHDKVALRRMLEPKK